MPTIWLPCFMTIAVPALINTWHIGLLSTTALFFIIDYVAGRSFSTPRSSLSIFSIAPTFIHTLDENKETLLFFRGGIHQNPRLLVCVGVSSQTPKNLSVMVSLFSHWVSRGGIILPGIRFKTVAASIPFTGTAAAWTLPSLNVWLFISGMLRKCETPLVQIKNTC